MKMPATTRGQFLRFGALLLCAWSPSALAGPSQNPTQPAPVVRMPPPPSRPLQAAPRSATSGPRGEHLGQWMQQHGSLSAKQQQRALAGEPGFNQLPAQTQQRMMQRLDHLNSMPEQQRERVISRNEAIERMTPQQRGEVRNAMGQLGALPQDRRRLVARSFRELRAMPPQERYATLNSYGYRQQFSDEERGTLGNLLSVSPLLPDNR
ncbi:MAG: DUF3106 domain-containing protein [Janthinobacterium lividum]